MFPGAYRLSFIKIGSVRAEILLTLSLCWCVGGEVVCKVIFMSNPTKVMLGWGWVELGVWQGRKIIGIKSLIGLINNKKEKRVVWFFCFFLPPLLLVEYYIHALKHQKSKWKKSLNWTGPIFNFHSFSGMGWWTDVWVWGSLPMFILLLSYVYQWPSRQTNLIKFWKLTDLLTTSFEEQIFWEKIYWFS